MNIQHPIILKISSIILLNIISFSARTEVDVDSLYKQAAASRSIELAHEVFKESKRIGNMKSAALALYLEAWLYGEKKDYVNSISSYLDAAEVYEQIGERKLLSDIYENVGNIFYRVLHYQNALLFYRKAIALRSDSENKNKRAQTLLHIANAHRQLGNYDSSLNYYKEASGYYNKARNQKKLLHVYNDIGVVMEMDKSYEMAQKYYTEALYNARLQKDTLWESRALHNLGAVAIKEQQIDKGIDYYLQALSLRQTLKNQKLLMSTLNNLGHCYLQQQQEDEALRYFTKAIDYIEHDDTELLTDTYLQLSKLEEQKGNASLALQYSREYEAVTQELYAINDQLEEKRLFFEGQLAFEQLKQRDQQQKIESSKWFWVKVVVALVSILTISLFIFYIKARQRKRTLRLIIQDLSI